MINQDRMNEKEEIVRQYFNSWIDNDSERLTLLLASEIVYIECYGPEYHGLEQVLTWFADWHMKGKVLEWSIKQIIIQKDTMVAEWYFRCEYEKNVDGFDGVSIITFNDSNRISSVKEFQSKAEHYYPYI